MTAEDAGDFQLLHVEDNELDAMALRRSFKKLGITLPLAWAKDGVEALEKLQSISRQQNPSSAQTVILLDINMPRMNGHEFLEALRADPNLSYTPVFILTTSEQPTDIRKAYDQHVAGYIVKPVGSGTLVDRIKHWSEFLSIIELPKPAH